MRLLSRNRAAKEELSVCLRARPSPGHLEIPASAGIFLPAMGPPDALAHRRDGFSQSDGDNVVENRVCSARNRCLAGPATRCLRKRQGRQKTSRNIFLGVFATVSTADRNAPNTVPGPGRASILARERLSTQAQPPLALGVKLQ